ncbi:MAG: hypothetical protein AB7I25_10840 [Vicinamibacterales bacterium]
MPAVPPPRLSGHIASVSWGDHLAFGEGDGRLATPDAVARRMEGWRRDLGATALHWRVFRRRIPGRFEAAPGHVHPSQAPDITWSELEVVPRLAREAGLASWLYVSVFDEGWPLAPPAVRAVSHHNAMHGRDVAWQSAFSAAHPGWMECDRTGTPQTGVMALAWPEVRRHFVERFAGWIRESAFDGLFLCLRSQSKPAAHGDAVGFTEPVRQRFLARHGVDILREDFDRQAWRDLRGEDLTALLRELRAAMNGLGRQLAVGAPRGDVLGPPLGNMTLAWRTWVAHGLIDALIVNQNSSRCPSMWHDLWPMHRGTGYVQNYLTGEGLPPLEQQLAANYAPALAGHPTRLYVARQWDGRHEAQEAALTALPGVSGLVFSTFRHDNPEAVRRNDWRF